MALKAPLAFCRLRRFGAPRGRRFFGGLAAGAQRGALRQPQGRAGRAAPWRRAPRARCDAPRPHLHDPCFYERTTTSVAPSCSVPRAHDHPTVHALAAHAAAGRLPLRLARTLPQPLPRCQGPSCWDPWPPPSPQPSARIAWGLVLAAALHPARVLPRARFSKLRRKAETPGRKPAPRPAPHPAKARSAATGGPVARHCHSLSPGICARAVRCVARRAHSHARTHANSVRL